MYIVDELVKKIYFSDTISYKLGLELKVVAETLLLLKIHKNYICVAEYKKGLFVF